MFYCHCWTRCSGSGGDTVRYPWFGGRGTTEVHCGLRVVPASQSQYISLAFAVMSVDAAARFLTGESGEQMV